MKYEYEIILKKNIEGEKKLLPFKGEVIADTKMDACKKVVSFYIENMFNNSQVCEIVEVSIHTLGVKEYK